MCVAHNKKSFTKIKEKPYTINLDWLEVTLKSIGKHFIELDEYGQPQNAIGFPNGLELIRQKNKAGTMYNQTKSYQVVYSVNLKGAEVGILQTISRYGLAELSQFKLSNYLLYEDSWHGVLVAVVDTIGATINNITRLDIAIDGKGFIAQHEKNRDLVRAGKLRKVGRAKTDLKESDSYKVEGFNIGTRKSGKLLTGYCKGRLLLSDKIKGRDHKPYIVDYWKTNGLINDTKQISKIERLEMKLTAKAVRAIEGLTVDKLTNPEYLAGIFEVHCNNFYQWTKKVKDTNTTRAKIKALVHPIEWSLLKSKEVKRVKAKPQKSAFWGVRMAVSFLMKEYYVKGEYAGWELSEDMQKAYSQCLQLVKEYGISDWFEGSLRKWENAFEDQQIIKETLLYAQIRASV